MNHLLKVMREYRENVWNSFPGNEYWSEKFEEAYNLDKANADSLPAERVVGHSQSNSEDEGGLVAEVVKQYRDITLQYSFDANKNYYSPIFHFHNGLLRGVKLARNCNNLEVLEKAIVLSSLEHVNSNQTG